MKKYSNYKSFSGIPGINESSLRHYLLAKNLSSKDCMLLFYAQLRTIKHKKT